MANNEKDDILFEQLNRNRKRKRRRIILTVVSLVLVVLVGLAIAVSVLRARVQERFAAAAANVKNYTAQVGRISTTVSGTGVLESVDAEKIQVPQGVEVAEILVSAGDSLKAGQPIASVKLSTVMNALASTQEELDELDKQIRTAKNDSVSSALTSAIGGRVKAIYAQKDDNIVDVMTEHGCVALLSLDGQMVVNLDADLSVGTAVTVRTAEKDYPGSVLTASGGKITVTVTDDGPKLDEEVTVFAEEREIGKGSLAIHNPLAVTGYAGTVSYVQVRENQRIYNGTTLFSLKNTGYSANYDALLQTREDTQHTLNTLIEMLRTGTVTAPFDGVVTQVGSESAASSPSSSLTASLGLTAVASASTSKEDSLVTMAPDKELSVTVGVDETNILSLKIGQKALVSVASIEEEDLPGVVTEVVRSAVSTAGVTQYSAVITLDKTERMLTGMTATVDIQIEGEVDAVIIPADAVHQTKNRSYVYTAYDEEAKEYGGEKEVTVGVSNSNFVEITSGLDAGETVYYTEKSDFPFFMMPMGGNRGSTRRTGG